MMVAKQYCNMIYNFLFFYFLKFCLREGEHVREHEKGELVEGEADS